MVSAGVSKLGKTSIHVVTPGAKMNSAYYCNEVSSQLLREMEQLSNGDYIFKQNGARSHLLKVTLVQSEEHCCKFLNQIFGHLKALTSILVIMLSGVHWKPKSGSQTLEDLKERIVEEWERYHKMLFPEQSTRLERVFAWSLRRMSGI